MARFDLVIQFFALKRSGGHALLNWIASQFSPGTVIFFNDVFLPNNPLVHRSEPSPLPVLNRERGYDLKDLDRRICIISYEDKPLENVAALSELRESWFQIPDDQILKVILVRDVLNCFASRLETTEKGVRNPKGEASWVKLKLTERESRDQLVNLWKSYACEFLGNTGYLQPKISLNFNDWISKRDYRKKVLEEIPETGFNDDELNVVSGYGYGSSFDGTNLMNEARKTALKLRYHQISPEKEKYLRIVRQDEELMNLNREIFGDIYR